MSRNSQALNKSIFLSCFIYCQVDCALNCWRTIDNTYVNSFTWTGSGKFNQWFRSIAMQRGYLLNEYGLYHRNDAILDNGNTVNKMIPVETEQDIFDIVGIEYVPPEHREV